MADRSANTEFERAAVIIALVIFGPAIALIALGRLLAVAAPILPLVGVALIGAAALFVWQKYRTSPHTVRRQHETELAELLARATAQQAALPRRLDPAELAAALARQVATAALAPAALLAGAQALYEADFLAALPGSPGVPLEAERVYDIDYDRRTLKKGEEPPYRLRTDHQGRPTTAELEAYEAALQRYLASTTNPKVTIRIFLEGFATIVAPILGALPALNGATKTPFTVPLIDLVGGNKGALAATIAASFSSALRDWQHFSALRATILRNRDKAAQKLLRVRDLNAGVALDPSDHPGTPREVLDAFLLETPLHDLLLTPVPFSVPLAKRFEGQWIVARQGSGKTNALECLIAADLAEVAANRASLLVMDSQGTSPDTLIGRLATLAAFQPGGALADKLIYLEPDLDEPLALNVFDIGLNRMGRLTARQHEDLVGSACEVVEFLFTGLLGGDLSDNMTMLYRYLVPAMLAIPDADMNTFIALLDTDSGRDRRVPAGLARYQPYFAKLEPDLRSFLDTDFLVDPELVKTKAAVRRRLRAALADTTFRRMFTQPRNKLDLFTELQSAKVILVNTFPARDHVEPFGRLILALLMQATRQRLEIDREERMPTFVYLDECQDYIAREERMARYIDKCRKQNVGLTFAHQRLANIESPRVLNALSGLSIKLAGVSDADASDLAGLVGSTPEHIRSLPRGRFATYVSGLTPQAVDLAFPASPLDRAPRIGAEAFASLRRTMRARYGEPYRPGGAAPMAVPPPITSGTPGVVDGRAEDYDPLA